MNFPNALPDPYGAALSPSRQPGIASASQDAPPKLIRLALTGSRSLRDPISNYNAANTAEQISANDG